MALYYFTHTFVKIKKKVSVAPSHLRGISGLALATPEEQW
jgi:hypothetical protein